MGVVGRWMWKCVLVFGVVLMLRKFLWLWMMVCMVVRLRLVFLLGVLVLKKGLKIFVMIFGVILGFVLEMVRCRNVLGFMLVCCEVRMVFMLCFFNWSNSLLLVFMVLWVLM